MKVNIKQWLLLSVFLFSQNYGNISLSKHENNTNLIVSSSNNSRSCRVAFIGPIKKLNTIATEISRISREERSLGEVVRDSTRQALEKILPVSLVLHVITPILNGIAPIFNVVGNILSMGISKTVVPVTSAASVLVPQMSFVTGGAAFGSGFITGWSTCEGYVNRFQKTPMNQMCVTKDHYDKLHSEHIQGSWSNQSLIKDLQHQHEIIAIKFQRAENENRYLVHQNAQLTNGLQTIQNQLMSCESTVNPSRVMSVYKPVPQHPRPVISSNAHYWERDIQHHVAPTPPGYPKKDCGWYGPKVISISNAEETIVCKSNDDYIWYVMITSIIYASGVISGGVCCVGFRMLQSRLFPGVPVVAAVANVPAAAAGG
jgi:hypothetical protein